jgi:protein SCO1/2
VARNALPWASWLLTLTVLGLASTACGAVPTFTKDVAPILSKHCANCHHELLSYDAARSSAKQVRKSVATRAMPPWPADPAHSLKFRNDPRLSDQDIATISEWADGGAPRGSGGDRSPEPNVSGQWSNPEGRPPDAVVSLPEIRVAAQGEVPYIQKLIKVPFAQDKWIVAMQLQPGNRNLLHHMGITEVQLPEGMQPSQLNEFAAAARTLGFPDGLASSTPPAVVDPTNPGAYDMLGVYTPGSTFEGFADDSGKLLKGGGNYYINFNIHYTATGRPESDRSQLGLWFRPTPPQHQLIRAPIAVSTILAEGKELMTDAPGTKAEGTTVAIPPIPAYAQSYEVIGVTAYTRPAIVYQLQPHAHMRAKDFTYVVIYPDGRELTVLSVPAYDFHWQIAYQLDQPLTLQPGSKVIVRAHYDNSQQHYDERIRAEDPGRNCGPEKVVYFRRQNQSWDEMFSPLAQYAVSGADVARAEPVGTAAVGAQTAGAKVAGKGALPLVRVVGCLKPGNAQSWLLARAGEPVTTNAQSTSTVELNAAAAERLGNGSLGLVGADVFNPRNHQGQKVAIKGVLIRDAHGSRINVTSLQRLADTCDGPSRLAAWPKAAESPDFELVDTDGVARSLSHYRGHIVVIYFGFLRCPDACPAELLKLALVMKRLGPVAAKVQVLFVTLDPERDRPAALKKYVTAFDSRFVGLTGTSPQVDVAASRFNIQYARVPLGSDYTIDHSTGVFVLDATGRLRLVGGAGASVDDFVHDLKMLVAESQ